MTRSFFNDLKVLDLSGILAGPLTGSFFAELGATVIKIENKLTGGDATRQWKTHSEDPDSKYSAYYCAANFGKKVIFLNLKDKNDRKVLENYLSETDVVISNYQKRVAESLDLSPEVITQRYPKVIFAQLSAYEYNDPRPGYDLIMQAEAGYISMTGTEEGKLCKMPVAMIDIIAAHQLKEGILMAMLNKSKTGEGSIIHVSLFNSAITGLANQASNYLMTGQVPKPLGTLHPNIAPYGDIFHSSDNVMFLLAVGSDVQFKKLWFTLNLSSENYLKFEYNLQRLHNRDKLQKLLQSKFASLNFEIINVILKDSNTAFCKILDLKDVFANPLINNMINIELLDDKICSKSVSSISFEIEPTMKKNYLK